MTELEYTTFCESVTEDDLREGRVYLTLHSWSYLAKKQGVEKGYLLKHPTFYFTKSIYNKAEKVGKVDILNNHTRGEGASSAKIFDQYLWVPIEFIQSFRVVGKDIQKFTNVFKYV
jgi:hypothetical protein